MPSLQRDAELCRRGRHCGARKHTRSSGISDGHCQSMYGILIASTKGISHFDVQAAVCSVDCAEGSSTCQCIYRIVHSEVQIHSGRPKRRGIWGTCSQQVCHLTKDTRRVVGEHAREVAEKFSEVAARPIANSPDSWPRAALMVEWRQLASVRAYSAGRGGERSNLLLRCAKRYAVDHSP